MLSPDDQRTSVAYGVADRNGHGNSINRPSRFAPFRLVADNNWHGGFTDI